MQVGEPLLARNFLGAGVNCKPAKVLDDAASRLPAVRLERVGGVERVHAFSTASNLSTVSMRGLSMNPCAIFDKVEYGTPDATAMSGHVPFRA